MRGSAWWLVIAGLNGIIAVAAGAYGWHGLGGDEIFALAVQYHMWHTLALLGVAWLSAEDSPGARPAQWAGGCFVAGMVLFSGALYGDVLLEGSVFSGAAPFGGYALMAGWGLLAWAGWCRARRKR